MELTQFFILPEDNEQALLAQAKHGDMFIYADRLRSTGVYFVHAFDELGNACTKTLIQKDETGSGYMNIPLSITRYFDNPVAYFLHNLTIKKAGIRKSDWYAIEISAKHHQQWLQSLTGGRIIPETRQVIYFVSEGNLSTGAYIWNPIAIDEDSDVWRRINKSLANRYLRIEPYYFTATDWRHIQKKNHKIYETDFLNWLAQAPKGTAISVRNIPMDINNAHREGASGTTMNLIKVFKLQDKTIIVLETTIHDWSTSKKHATASKIEVTFSPEILTTEKKFGNIHFWINREMDYMIVVPTWAS